LWVRVPRLPLRNVPLAERQRCRPSKPARRVQLPQGTFSASWPKKESRREWTVESRSANDRRPKVRNWASSQTPAVSFLLSALCWRCKRLSHVRWESRGSANGRLPAFEAGDEGSNPSPRTLSANDESLLRGSCCWYVTPGSEPGGRWFDSSPRKFVGHWPTN
jgi:hypothetical protein